MRSLPERRAVFLDRDGVLVADPALNGGSAPVDPLEPLEPLPGVASALARLRAMGWALVVVTNQPVIARGLAHPDQVEEQHLRLNQRLGAEGGGVDAFYFCPHHPLATVAEYRVSCRCRKPLPGMLEAAADDLDIDLAASMMVGDRVTDVEAGVRAGCQLTVLVESPFSDAPRIQTDAPPLDVVPDRRVESLAILADLLGSR